MPSKFTSSKQSVSIPQAGEMGVDCTTSKGLSDTQAGSLTEQQRLQRALMSPHETLQQISQP